MAIYKYNPDTKEVELISNRNGKLQTQVHMPRDTDHSGHFFENLNCRIHSKAHKREVMKKMGVAEA